jgi:hypothetical protein
MRFRLNDRLRLLEAKIAPKVHTPVFFALMPRSVATRPETSSLRPSGSSTASAQAIRCTK